MRLSRPGNEISMGSAGTIAEHVWGRAEDDQGLGTSSRPGWLQAAERMRLPPASLVIQECLCRHVSAQVRVQCYITVIHGSYSSRMILPEC